MTCMLMAAMGSCSLMVLIHSLASWLNSSQAATLVPCLDAHLRRQLQAASESINVAISMTQTATDELDIGASTGAQECGLWFIALGVCS